MKTRSFDFRDSLLSLLAIAIALFFIFPLYWGFSTSLRNPLDTFTVTGVGLPWLNFSPTLNNWISQLEICLLYTSPSPRDTNPSRMPSSA